MSYLWYPRMEKSPFCQILDFKLSPAAAQLIRIIGGCERVCEFDSSMYQEIKKIKVHSRFPQVMLSQ